MLTRLSLQAIKIFTVVDHTREEVAKRRVLATLGSMSDEFIRHVTEPPSKTHDQSGHVVYEPVSFGTNQEKFSWYQRPQTLLKDAVHVPEMMQCLKGYRVSSRFLFDPILVPSPVFPLVLHLSFWVSLDQTRRGCSHGIKDHRLC
eukprot:CAMPEP_0184651216 /NCGR_PEP_ID=MMETSP0308-20130426/8803_1 /TAXON_ID=38269 /ORGANISM="Gloeochaete witrockiana, Strain SAG 46.84" /LENGTH=144 /DNA_ID=CAMNT_0027085275 /DNA_START=735 /DNA_END=1169 /DNA_ORIENTATION=-